MYRTVFLLLFIVTISCHTAPIEEKDGKTIITLKVPNRPALPTCKFFGQMRVDQRA